MKICPKCKNEYRDGITHCADCDCELISINEDHSDKKVLIQAPYPVVKKIQDKLTKPFSSTSSVAKLVNLQYSKYSCIFFTTGYGA